MATIPKFRLNNTTKENFGVANVQARGDAKAKTIAAFSSAANEGINSAATIMDLKQQQEATTISREQEIALQDMQLNDKTLLEDYRAKHNGNMTGYATHKANYLQEQQESMANNIGHRKVKDNFLKNSSNTIRKGLVYDYQKENKQILALAEKNNDLALASAIKTIDTIPAGNTGDKDFQIELSDSVTKIDQQVQAGLLSTTQGESLKSEMSDTLVYSRIQNLVRDGSYGSARDFLDKSVFNSPKMQIKALQQMNAAESRRLKDKKDRRDLEIEDLRKEKTLSELRGAKGLKAISDSNLSPKEKLIRIRQTIDSLPYAPQASLVKRYTGEVAGEMLTNTLGNWKSRIHSTDVSLEELRTISSKASAMFDANADNEQVRESIAQISSTITRKLEKEESSLHKQEMKKFEKSGGFSKTADQMEQFENYLEKFESLPVELRFQRAQAEYDKENLRFGKLSEGELPSITGTMRSVEGLAKIYGPADAAKKAAIRNLMIQKVRDANWFGVSTKEEAQVDSLLNSADKVHNSNESYANTIREIEGKVNGNQYATD